MASTSDRRSLLKALALAPFAGLVPARLEARDYTSAAEVFTEIDRLDGVVSARLAAFATALPAAVPLARSFQADHRRHRVERDAQRRRLGLPPGSLPAADADASFEGLQTELEALVYAHAEGLAALGDAVAVDALARHMVDLARQITVLRLWQDQEDALG